MRKPKPHAEALEEEIPVGTETAQGVLGATCAGEEAILEAGLPALQLWLLPPRLEMTPLRRSPPRVPDLQHGRQDQTAVCTSSLACSEWVTQPKGTKTVRIIRHAER